MYADPRHAEDLAPERSDRLLAGELLAGALDREDRIVGEVVQRGVDVEAVERLEITASQVGELVARGDFGRRAERFILLRAR